MCVVCCRLEKLTIPVLIDRLVLRRQYSLAIKIAEFLKLRESQGRSRILAHWACYKVGQTHIEEGKLADEIYEKLKSDTSISYSEIANKAFDAGRKKLALKVVAICNLLISSEFGINGNAFGPVCSWLVLRFEEVFKCHCY